jgi:hypothetical protein
MGKGLLAAAFRPKLYYRMRGFILAGIAEIRIKSKHNNPAQRSFSTRQVTLKPKI